MTWQWPGLESRWPKLKAGSGGVASCRKVLLKPQTTESEVWVKAHSSCVSLAWPSLTLPTARERERKQLKQWWWEMEGKKRWERLTKRECVRDKVWETKSEWVKGWGEERQSWKEHFHSCHCALGGVVMGLKSKAFDLQATYVKDPELLT